VAPIAAIRRSSKDSRSSAESRHRTSAQAGDRPGGCGASTTRPVRCQCASIHAGRVLRRLRHLRPSGVVRSDPPLRSGCRPVSSRAERPAACSSDDRRRPRAPVGVDRGRLPLVALHGHQRSGQGVRCPGRDSGGVLRKFGSSSTAFPRTRGFWWPACWDCCSSGHQPPGPARSPRGEP
jgi:hypothetical protein